MKIFLLILILLVSSCAKKAQEVNHTSNADFEVSKLFTHDGCTIYRFTDTGKYIYFSKCGNLSQTNYSESCGKNCTRNMSITTETIGGKIQ